MREFKGVGGGTRATAEAGHPVAGLYVPFRKRVGPVQEAAELCVEGAAFSTEKTSRACECDMKMGRKGRVIWVLGF